MFVSNELFFRRKDISVLFWFLFSFWRGFVYFLPLEWVGDCFLVFSTTDFFSSVSRPGCISSLYALSHSLSCERWQRNHRLLTVLLGFVSHWALSFFPARRKDSVVPQRGGAQCSNPEMGIFPGMASTSVSGSSFPTLLLSFLGFRLSIWLAYSYLVVLFCS